MMVGTARSSKAGKGIRFSSSCLNMLHNNVHRIPLIVHTSLTVTEHGYTFSQSPLLSLLYGTPLRLELSFCIGSIATMFTSSCKLLLYVIIILGKWCTMNDGFSVRLMVHGKETLR